MERQALEDEVTRLTARLLDDEALPTRADAALNVFEVFLQNIDGQTELAPQIIDGPLAIAEQLENRLPTCLARCHRYLPKRSNVLTF
jgi:hypothetical protein